MKCPTCGLINPEGALRCDCGYDFATGTMQEPYLESRALPVGKLASLGERLLGQILDSLVVIAAIGVSAVPFVFSEPLGSVTLICGLLFALFYILLSDGFMGGQSYGKRIMQTAVVDASSGQACTFGKSFIRNLLSLLGMFDWIFIFGKKRQRLGDMAANTLVVKRRKSVGLGLELTDGPKHKLSK